MNIMKKSLLWLLCIGTGLAGLSSCGTEKPEGSSASEEAELPAGTVLIANQGGALYTLVRGADEKSANDFKTALEAKTGAAFSMTADTEAPAETAEAKEILVGVTNRTDEETVRKLGILEYRISEKGNNIEVLAKSGRALQAALDAILSEEVLRVENGQVTVGGLPLSGHAPLGECEVPEFTYGYPEEVYRSSDTTSVIRVKGTKAEDYEAYLNDLHTAGFVDYASNKIKDNLFTTLTNETTTVNFYYIATTGISRVVYEKKGPLYPLTDDRKDGGVQCLMTGMMGETSVASEGMGFIIRLNDGSFIIIDGGMGDPKSVDSNKLMSILNKQNTNGGKPVIAAWLFTHEHGDHIGVFNCFSIDHHDDVVLESIYYNFPKDEETKASKDSYMLDDSLYRYTQFRKCLKEYYPNVPVIKPHTGNKFQIRNATFEVLATLEDLVPITIVTGGMNESSELWKMTIGGQTMLWTGDIGASAEALAMRQFGDYLKSDMLQIAHHGNNGSVAFYSTINPTYSFLPVWTSGVNSKLEKTQNQWLVNSKDMRQMIITGYGSWTIPLPYNPAEGTFKRIPKINTMFPNVMGG